MTTLHPLFESLVKSFDRVWSPPTTSAKLVDQINENEARGWNYGGGIWSVYDINNKMGLIYTGGSREEDPFTAYGGVHIAANCGLVTCGELLSESGACVYFLTEFSESGDCPKCGLPCGVEFAEVGLSGHSAQEEQDFEWDGISDCCHAKTKTNREFDNEN